MSKVICLTCTGDRPQLLERSKYYFERSIVDIEKEWLVVDDGLVPYNPGGCTYIRRNPDGPISLGRNLRFALNYCDCDYIVIWEDDDWCSPNRINSHVDKLKLGYDLHGYKNTIYYHINNGWRINGNIKHSSLCETAISGKMINKLLSYKLEHEKFIDVTIWKYLYNTSLLEDQSYQVIGIKGGPGRHGIGYGHKAGCQYNKDINFNKLKEFVNGDADFYINLTK